jgi:signal transduction histidine kinase
MTTELERQLSRLGRGEHLCPVHETLAEEMASAVFFMKLGLARGECCLYIANDQTVEKVFQMFAATGVDVAHECARGALQSLTTRATFQSAGEFNPQAMIDFLQRAESGALAAGFSGSRVIVAEKSWTIGPQLTCERLVEYEVHLQQILPNSRTVLICQYNRESCGAAIIHDVLLTHRLVILGEQVCPNPFYEPPDLVLRGPAQPSAELLARRVDWRIHQLKEARRGAQEREQILERLQALSRRLLEVQEEERRHLARELHDEFGQILATITLHLHAARGMAGTAALPQLNECATLLQQAGEQVRSLALELRPTMLDTLGLEAALRWLAEQHQQRTGCEVQLVGQLSGTLLPPEMAIACFRVAQEALTNVVRHAMAQHVWIELNRSEILLELVVRDDGVGFNVAPSQVQPTTLGSLGLLGMRERVEIFGGSLKVESEPGRGTRVHASFPLTQSRDDASDQVL